MTERELELRRTAVAYFGGRERPFSYSELAEYFGVSTHTVKRWMRAEAVKAFEVGRVVRFRVEHVYEFIESRTA